MNSVLLRRNARFVYFDFKKNYVQTPMEQSEYVCIKLLDIPQEFIDEYNLRKQPKIDVYILRFSVVAMAFRNQADSPMTSYATVLRRQYITRPTQHLVSGAISGAPPNLF